MLELRIPDVKADDEREVEVYLNTLIKLRPEFKVEISAKETLRVAVNPNASKYDAVYISEAFHILRTLASLNCQKLEVKVFLPDGAEKTALDGQLTMEDQKVFQFPPRSQRTARAPYQICEYCGAHLDAGEQCDCQKSAGAAPKQKEEA